MLSDSSSEGRFACDADEEKLLAVYPPVQKEKKSLYGKAISTGSPSAEL